MLVKVFASFGLLICLALAVHMCLGRHQRLWLETRLTRAWQGLRQRLERRFSARERRRAAHEAALEAIERAKRGSGGGGNVEGQWDGNVYRPKRFEKPPK
ncbi:hypothetical protein G8A07_23170 [Roseateles sp. DAIF2]|uniref:hypothetical protein n=1 Tax=Roseateles sp. DAIF2 TaxID=2714952 RepID=UPI0018A2A412|nr:hypothetical protein [Roseateles sp. DAIF2]QPF75532.1 hypothetical protein G8A07_23170 [Roseateles sp. DAIF2]